MNMISFTYILQKGHKSGGVSFLSFNIDHKQAINVVEVNHVK